ncbi:MAG: cell division protein FtsX [Pseudomonadota bacterium]
MNRRDAAAGRASSEEARQEVPWRGRLRLLPRGGWGAALATLSSMAMAFLALVTIATGIAAARLGSDWQAALTGSATVRIAADAQGAPGTEADAAARVIAVLEGTPGIATARMLDRAEQAALLEPWLGEGEALSSLPVPQLIDVTLAGAGPDVAALQSALEVAAPGTVYDDHGSWRGPLIEGARSVERLALGASLLVALAAAGMVALAARASLAGNAEIVRVVRLIGGEDRFIARAFVRPLAWRTGAGAAFGAGLAAAALAFMPEAGAEVGLDLAPAPALLALLAIAVALGAGLIGWMAAQIAVRAALAELP